MLLVVDVFSQNKCLGFLFQAPSFVGIALKFDATPHPALIQIGGQTQKQEIIINSHMIPT